MKFPPRSTICAETVRLTDLMATCAAIVNARLPNDAGEDSASILPLLLSGKPMKPTHEAVVHQSEGGFLAIRQGNWKLVCDQTPANGESRKRGQRNQISQRYSSMTWPKMSAKPGTSSQSIPMWSNG